MNKDTYCPWFYKALTLEGPTIKPCCRFDDELTNLSTLDDFRSRITNGERLSGCSQCWEQEDLNIESMRQQGISKWGYPTDVNIEFLEFGIDNTCNLRCLTCCSWLSTAWIKEEKKIFGKSINSKSIIGTDVADTIDLSNVKTVKFVGGEPLMSSAITSISLRLLELENLELFVSTNGTVLPDPVVEKLFLECEKLNLSVSIDGLYDLNNFIRYPTNWEIIESNLNFFNNLINQRKNKLTSINYHVTVNAYNVNYFHQIEDYFKQNFPNFSLSFSVLTKPEFMAIRNLPIAYKELIRKDIHNKEILSFLDSQRIDLFDHFIQYHKKIIEVRQIDFSKVNTVLHNFISKYDHTPVNMEEVFKMKAGAGYEV